MSFDGMSTQQSVRTEQPSVEETVAPITLTAADRCVRCGAAAIARATSLDTGTQLLFCGHHVRAHLVALRDKQWRIQGHIWAD